MINYCLTMLVLVLVLLGPVSASRSCVTVNGVEGACQLKLSQLTLAGSHNSGCGAYGSMWHWSGLNAKACWYRNQGLAITAQLDLGIRYFDFDVSYISAGDAQGSGWYEEGVVIVHGKGYSRSLHRALTEIAEYMDQHRDEVIVIRISDAAQEVRVREVIEEEFKFLEQRMNSERDPLLKDAIMQDRRLFLFTYRLINTAHKYHHLLQQVESVKGGGSFGCYGISEVTDSLQTHTHLADTAWQVQINWYFTHGLCIRELARLCNGEELLKLELINNWLLEKTNRPVNLVLVDYAGTADVRLSEVVLRMNQANIQHLFNH